MDRDAATRGKPTDFDLALLGPLARDYPTLDAAVAEVARLSAELTLPKQTVHVISDVHGEFAKFRHVINNASGTLRPLIERLFGGRRGPAEVAELLKLVFYPREALDRIGSDELGHDERLAFVRRTLRDLFAVVRDLARVDSLARATSIFPDEYAELLRELLHEPSSGRDDRYFDAMIDALIRHGRALRLIRLTVRVLRNLAIDELVLAGDCWDRGPRGDQVVDYLMHLPRVAFTWGNHDAAWYGACLGHRPLIAHVLRISARYRRFSQIEEGYGITLQPIEHLVRAVYADDPAEAFTPKHETGLRDPITMARLQKAAAVMQFKLEGQMIARNPEFRMDDRRLLHRMDLQAGTITIDGTSYPLRDRRFPTIDPVDPYTLSPEESACMERLRKSFMASQKLWDHVRFLVTHGSMYLVRDDHLIFHGCVPVNADGSFQTMTVDGEALGGRPLFDKLDAVIARALYDPDEKDLDLLWYLWCGPQSPLFGKDRIATLENDLVADKSTHTETKNAYFRLIHEAEFCDAILREFGVAPGRGLIVNGHVPVKIEQGESPLKRSGKAITIDGAFSEAYGDHGYTLVLEPDRTVLAKHHHFESVEAAVRDGVDIVPEVREIRRFEPPRTIGDTERGDELRRRIELLERLCDAYRRNLIRPVR